MSASAPLVTVIIPTFNREKFISRAIESVIAQTYKNIQIIVVDDASTDRTKPTLNSYLSSKILVLDTRDNLSNHEKYSSNMPLPRGVSFARNLGISKAQGEYIAFLDSDDVWHSDKLEKQVSALQNSNYQWVHCNELWIRNDKPVRQLKHHQKSGGDQFERSLEICCIGASCVVIKRSLFETEGVFNTDLKVCEDYDLWLRFLIKYPIEFVSEDLVTKYAGHPGQLSVQEVAIDEYRVKSLVLLFENQGLSNQQKSLVAQHIVKKSSLLEKGFRKHLNFQLAEKYSQIAKQYESL